MTVTYIHAIRGEKKTEIAGGRYVHLLTSSNLLTVVHSIPMELTLMCGYSRGE